MLLEIPLLGGLLFWLICCFLVGSYWSSKGRSGFGGFLVSFFFSPLIGFFIGLLLTKDEKKIEERKLKSGEYKKCPYCSELIRADAKVCKYCGKEISDSVA